MGSEGNDSEFNQSPTLRYLGDPALRQRCRDIPAITPAIIALGRQMILIMREHQGIGLAASQVGVLLNLIVIEIPPAELGSGEPAFTSPGELSLIPRMPLILINPTCSAPSSQTAITSEGCLSIPGIRGDVARPEFIHLEAMMGDNAQPVSYRCGGLLARCLQHEMDHLRGVLFIDRLEEYDRRSVFREARKLEKKLANSRMRN